jgi:tetratricopeptide (TPR) repeat protein
MPTFRLTERNVSAVERICERLDGIPLAIELAAARVAVLSPVQIVTRLDDRFRLLTGGSRTAPLRYRSLKALVDWSHDLLDDRERLLFRRLAVFAGGWTLEAAESVCAGDGLAPAEVLDLLSGLVTKSLVMSGDRGDGVRYWLLETLREYAAEKLRAADEEPKLRRRHGDWLVALAEDAEPALEGPRQIEWLRRLDDEHDNLRAALAWSVEFGGTETGLRLATALSPFWAARGLIGEGRRWLAELLTARDATLASDSDARLRSRALHAAGCLAVNAGDHVAAQHLLTRALDIAQALDDRPARADGAYGLGFLARVRGDYAGARTFLEEALTLSRELGDVTKTADTLVSLGVVAYFEGDLSVARALYQDGLAAYQALGNRRGMAKSLNDLGEVALEEGDLAAARRFEEESLTIASEVGEPERLAMALAALAGVAASQGEAARAASGGGRHVDPRGDRRAVLRRLARQIRPLARAGLARTECGSRRSCLGRWARDVDRAGRRVRLAT